MYCRDLTADYDEVSVVSGPLFLPEEDQDSGKRYVKYEVSNETIISLYGSH